MATNSPFVIHGSMPNDGPIGNLPGDGVVKVACPAGARLGHHGDAEPASRDRAWLLLTALSVPSVSLW